MDELVVPVPPGIGFDAVPTPRQPLTVNSNIPASETAKI
jgi:hypothetical protein